jgi:hypothetical protein
VTILIDLGLIQKKFGDLLYKNSYSRALFGLWGLTIREISKSFAQFFTWEYPIRSLIRTFGIIISSMVRVFLGRSLKYSFGFAGEDRIIEGILKPLIGQTGYYVDVGCNHPQFLSNTYGLYRKGWRGICIDANPKLIDKFPLFRPKDRALCRLISDTPGVRTFYEVQNPVLSTTEEVCLEEFRKEGLNIHARIMQAHTMTEVLDGEHAPRQFELLSIDVEEHDFRVLQSLDLKKYRPRLIVIEDETFDPIKPQNNQVYQWLTAFGYSLEGFILKNIYFKNVLP